MKKNLFIISLVTGICLSHVPVYASLSDVNDFLADYNSNAGVFYTEEYIDSTFDNKTLFVRAAIGKETNSTGFLQEDSGVFAELAKQEWFDYDSICCVTLGTEPSGFVSFKNYKIGIGTVAVYGYLGGLPKCYPWLIKTEGELPQDEKKFLGRVAQELLRNNINAGINLEIGNGGENKLSISESGGAAEVCGVCEWNGNTYDFTIVFTYEMNGECDGTYDTIYVGANGIDLFGEYQELMSIKLN